MFAKILLVFGAISMVVFALEAAEGSESGLEPEPVGSHSALHYLPDHYHHDHHTVPQYAFKYGVHDPHTGDVKSAWEHRDGDTTKGGYSVLEPDGHTRVVEYIVTKKGGFQATVKRLPPHHGY